MSSLEFANHKEDRASQTQSEIHRAISALPTHTEITTELRKLQSRLRDDQKQKRGDNQDLLRQLSNLDFTAMQKESYSKRHANTGQWLLESPDFQNWLHSEGDQNSVLWYQGDPGVGKTVITSIAINHVTESTGRRKSAITYIYCDYANTMALSVENLLGSVLGQLVVQISDADAGTIAELQTFLKSSAKNRKLTEQDSSSWIETFSRNFDVVYMFVDALDECPENDRDRLMRRLQRYGLRNMRVFLTSRSNVNVTLQIPQATRATMMAADDDISTYVESKIQECSRLDRFTTRDPEMKQHIVQTICSQAKGMFLLASLQLESLGHQTTPRGVLSALKRLPSDLFTMYDQTIERIRDLPTEEAKLGLKVLSVIFGAMRPLKIDELRHALAIQPGDKHLDLEALVDLDILLNATVGLVTTYVEDRGYRGQSGQESIRLVHYTLQQYFEINQKRIFPNLKVDMARTCLSYLCLDVFGSGKCATKQLTVDRMNEFCFLHYASRFWDLHLCAVQTELMQQSLDFVQDRMKVYSWLDCFEYGYHLDLGRLIDGDLPLDPVFLAAHFHLSELFRKLISSRNIDTRNKKGETPLLRAVDVTPWYKGGDHDEKVFRYSTRSSSVRLDHDQYAMVQTILDLNADINAKDSDGMTAAFRAVYNHDRGILSLLLDRGADIHILMMNSTSLLHFAAENEQGTDIMQLILDKSADVNVLNSRRESPIHVAANHRTSAILDLLIDHGAAFDIADRRGMTPLLLAAERGRLETLSALIKWGARLDVTDFTGKTPLHFAVSVGLPEVLVEVVEVVLRTQNVDALDKKGRTPLHHIYFRLAEVSGPVTSAWNVKLADVIRRLVEAGASETILDADGRTPKDYLDWSTYEHFKKWDRGYNEIMRAFETEEKWVYKDSESEDSENDWVEWE